jgi:hypothetical protein
MRRRNVVLKTVFSIFIGALIGFMLALAFPAHADESNKTFCQFWVTGTQEQHVKFMLDREPLIHAALIEKFPDRKDAVDVAMKCYVEEVADIVGTLNKECSVEKALSDFFGNQVDSTDKEMEDITNFINQCADKAFNHSS